MRRREFIALLGGMAGAWPLAAQAQQKPMRVIGLLGGAVPDDREVARNLTALRQGLAEAGYVEGQNLRIEYRWAAGHYERLPQLAAELVAAKVEVIVNEGGAVSVHAASQATTSLPIVFHTGIDPVAEGLVASLARPGGNLTGISLEKVDLMPKLLQLILGLVSDATVIALLVNPNSPDTELVRQNIQEAAKSLRIQVSILKAATGAEIDAAFATLGKQPAKALIVNGDTFFTTRRDQLVSGAADHAIPTIYTQTLFVLAGGLLSYGPSLPDAYRLKGVYAAKILDGTKPADLPILQPTKFELAVNVKTAKMLGLTVPTTLLATADEVIE